MTPGFFWFKGAIAFLSEFPEYPGDSEFGSDLVWKYCARRSTNPVKMKDDVGAIMRKDCTRTFDLAEWISVSDEVVFEVIADIDLEEHTQSDCLICFLVLSVYIWKFIDSGGVIDGAISKSIVALEILERQISKNQNIESGFGVVAAAAMLVVAVDKNSDVGQKSLSDECAGEHFCLLDKISDFCLD